jgi:hypothetical protein
VMGIKSAEEVMVERPDSTAERRDSGTSVPALPWEAVNEEGPATSRYAPHGDPRGVPSRGRAVSQRPIGSATAPIPHAQPPSGSPGARIVRADATSASESLRWRRGIGGPAWDPPRHRRASPPLRVPPVPRRGSAPSRAPGVLDRDHDPHDPPSTDSGGAQPPSGCRPAIGTGAGAAAAPHPSRLGPDGGLGVRGWPAGPLTPKGRLSAPVDRYCRRPPSRRRRRQRLRSTLGTPRSPPPSAPCRRDHQQEARSGVPPEGERP